MSSASPRVSVQRSQMFIWKRWISLALGQCFLFSCFSNTYDCCQSIALYGLFLFYGLTKDELKGRRPLSKFLSIKLIGKNILEGLEGVVDPLNT